MARSLRFSVASWNIDGLGEKAVERRAQFAASELLKHNPDCIFLQEVVPENIFLFVTRLSSAGFDSFCEKSDQNYFNAVFLKSSVFCDSKMTTIDFPTTRMGRHMIVVETKTKDSALPLTFITSHLESCKESAAERIKQLREVKDRISRINHPVIFAGDTNLRDTELKGLDTASVMRDVWEFCGKPKDAQFTWDLALNNTVSMPDARFVPRCRFDRGYFNSPSLFKSQPSSFRLIGLEKQGELFPSDHFGIMWTHEVGERTEGEEEAASGTKATTKTSPLKNGNKREKSAISGPNSGAAAAAAGSGSILAWASRVPPKK